MKSILEMSKWLLEKDIRAKNATSLLIALLSVIVFYFASSHRPWFRDVEGYGTPGVATALGIVLLTSFLAATVVISGVANYRQHLAALRHNEEQARSEKRAIRRELESLTEWQRRFLLRCISERRTQIPEFELGDFRAIIDHEIVMLVEKGIVKEHRRARVYEIEPVYLDYLRSNWNSETGDLS